jgi:DNA-binding NarL/FixJ family response regulator
LDALTTDARSLLEMLRGRVRLLSDGHSAEIEHNLDAVRHTMSSVERQLNLIVDVTHSRGARLDPAHPTHWTARVRGPRGAGGSCPLTSREVEVLGCLAEGMVYKQIAHELDLSASTVRSHLHHIYAKTGTYDRAQAVLLAADEGWL